MSLIHCIYASTAQQPCDDSARRDLLLPARANNARQQVTGVLLAIDDGFIHILEGEAAVVDELFLHIAGDPRHCDVTEIVREPIQRRHFAPWALGYANVERAAITNTPGLDSLFEDIERLQDIDAGRALTLFAAFARLA